MAEMGHQFRNHSIHSHNFNSSSATASPVQIPILVSPLMDRPTTRRKRSQSTAEIITIPSSLILQNKAKRVRIGIQDLSTTSSTSKLQISRHPKPSFNESDTISHHGRENGPTILDVDNSGDIESTSSDSNEEDDDGETSTESHLHEEAYDSDSESGSTTTSSSSSNSGTNSEDKISDNQNEIEAPPPPSSTNGFLPPKQFSKPTFANPLAAPSSSLLAKRFHAFIPHLAAANLQLEVEREKGTLGERNIEAIDEEEEAEGGGEWGGQYIEMNLGLGVLEPISNADKGIAVGSSQGSEEDGDESEGPSDGERSGSGGIMDGLMGLKRKKGGRIQVVD